MYAPFATDQRARTIEMKRKGTLLTRDLFHTAVEAATRLHRPDRVLVLLNDMHTCQVPINVFMLNHLLMVCCC